MYNGNPPPDFRKFLSTIKNPRFKEGEDSELQQLVIGMQDEGTQKMMIQQAKKAAQSQITSPEADASLREAIEFDIQIVPKKKKVKNSNYSPMKGDMNID